MNAQSRRVGLFACQAYFLTVGKPYGFSNEADFYRYAVSCGFEFLTMPLADPIVNPALLLDATYRDSRQEEIRGYGLLGGITRFEAHCPGQAVCVAPSRAARVGAMIGLKNPTHYECEAAGADQMKAAIDVSHFWGFTTLPGFCGGRGYPSMLAKWPAWPKGSQNVPLALLAMKWESILCYAADRGVCITFEIGHPENDILTGTNFVTFWKMLSPKARSAVGINADKSHYDNVGVNAMSHFLYIVAQTGCRVTGHFKEGVMLNKGPSTSTYGGWTPWSASSTTFCTYGTTGNEQLSRQFCAFMLEQNAEVVGEGECTVIQNPLQAMRIIADNCRAAIEGGKFTRVTGSGAFSQDWMLEDPKTDPRIVGPDGREVAFDPWPGGPFDEFATSSVPVEKILDMDAGEVHGTMQCLKQIGDEQGIAALRVAV